MDLTVTATAQCVAGRANLSVRAVNGEDVAVNVALTSPFGAKTFASVAPGKSASQSFNSRAPSIAAGTAKAVGTIGTGRRPARRRSTSSSRPSPAADRRSSSAGVVRSARGPGANPGPSWAGRARPAAPARPEGGDRRARTSGPAVLPGALNDETARGHEPMTTRHDRTHSAPTARRQAPRRASAILGER
ncbi:hypothetical protein NKG05_06470 [Oerskovia sp. M15]